MSRDTATGTAKAPLSQLVSFPAPCVGILSAPADKIRCPAKKPREPVTAINTSLLDQKEISGCYLFPQPRRMHNPSLVMHTEQDRLVEISHAERNFKWSASSQKHFLRMPAGDHNTIVEWNQNEYFKAIRDFMKGVESGQTVA